MASDLNPPQPRATSQRNDDAATSSSDIQNEDRDAFREDEIETVFSNPPPRGANALPPLTEPQLAVLEDSDIEDATSDRPALDMDEHDPTDWMTPEEPRRSKGLPLPDESGRVVFSDPTLQSSHLSTQHPPQTSSEEPSTQFVVSDIVNSLRANAGYETQTLGTVEPTPTRAAPPKRTRKPASRSNVLPELSKRAQDIAKTNWHRVRAWPRPKQIGIAAATVLGLALVCNIGGSDPTHTAPQNGSTGQIAAASVHSGAIRGRAATRDDAELEASPEAKSDAGKPSALEDADEETPSDLDGADEDDTEVDADSLDNEELDEEEFDEEELDADEELDPSVARKQSAGMNKGKKSKKRRARRQRKERRRRAQAAKEAAEQKPDAAATKPRTKPKASAPTHRELLTQARSARGREAYELASASYAEKRSPAALERMATAACEMKNKSLAKSAAGKLPIGEQRRRIRDRCRDHGVRLGLVF